MTDETEQNEITSEQEESPISEPTEVSEVEEVASVTKELKIFLQITGSESLVDLLAKRQEILGDDEFNLQILKDGTYENTLAAAVGDYSQEAERILTHMEKLGDIVLENKFLRDGKVILSSLLTPSRGSREGRILTGREAQIEFAIKTGLMRRVPLYNSGFFIDIEAPNLSLLNNFFTKAHSKTLEYGRDFGAHFFYFNDLMAKEAIVELVTQVTLGSSLKNWNRKNNLLSSIKLPDLKGIIMAIAGLMYPDGFEFTHVCTNPNGTCTHHESLRIDINKFSRPNYMKLTSEQISQMVEQKEISAEKIVEYQTPFEENKVLRYGKLEFELHIPSVAEYLEFGKKFNAQLTQSTFANSNSDIYRSLVFSLYKVYTPYIKTVTVYDNDGNKDAVSPDPEIISHMLARLQESDTSKKFIEDITNFISDAEILLLGYPVVPCPICNYVPEEKKYFSLICGLANL